MEIRDLEYFIAIAEEKSISKAAGRLYMAQSSLSQFLSSYEANLGYPLSFVPPAGYGLRKPGNCCWTLPTSRPQPTTGSRTKCRILPT